MKYRYIVISESNEFYGANELTTFIKDGVEAGIYEVIDCKFGECLQRVDSEEWESIEVLEED